jgi:hypothetical protein
MIVAVFLGAVEAKKNVAFNKSRFQRVNTDHGGGVRGSSECTRSLKME